VKADEGESLESLPVRRSIRLRGFDYRSHGAYFVTIMVEGRACLLGKSVDDGVSLGRVGQIVERVWSEIPAHFPRVGLDAFVVMPNHVHGILLLEGVGAKHASPLHHLPRGAVPRSLAAIVQSFKSASTRKVNLHRATPGARLWQRGYYEHVVRSGEDLKRLRAYIDENPLRWALDEENPERVE
jgi:REP element-mobilizing transposase RayT